MKNSKTMSPWLLIAPLLTLAGTGCSTNMNSAESARLGLRNPDHTLPAAGVPITLKARNIAEMMEQPSAKASNVMILFIQDAKPVSYEADAKILMFEHGASKEPLYTVSTQDLKNMHQTTHCDPSLLSYIKGAEGGDALFCNNAIDMTRVSYFVIKEANGDADYATSYVVDFKKTEKDLIAVTIRFD